MCHDFQPFTLYACATYQYGPFRYETSGNGHGLGKPQAQGLPVGYGLRTVYTGSNGIAFRYGLPADSRIETGIAFSRKSGYEPEKADMNSSSLIGLESEDTTSL